MENIMASSEGTIDTIADSDQYLLRRSFQNGFSPINIFYWPDACPSFFKDEGAPLPGNRD